MPTTLELEDAHKRFGETRALAGADLELRAGECLALLGPNGAGKTTLVRSVAGRVRLDRGRLRLFGQSVPLASPGGGPRWRLGIVPQEIALYPLLTARENLLAFGSLSALVGKELGERVDRALGWTGLEHRADDQVRTFSGGMRRRLNIAAGVLHDPEIVLLDEPTVGVDPQSRERIWQMLEGLRRAGASLLVTTHQLDEAQQVADRIAILDHGRTVAAGSFDELVASTVGRGRRLTFTLASRPAESLAEAGFALGERTLELTVEEVAKDLPPLLERLAAAGAEVEDLRVEAPSLQAVFIHLTGRELRE